VAIESLSLESALRPLLFDQRSAINRHAAAKATTAPDHLVQRWRRIAALGGMLANSRVSKSTGTGGAGKSRKRASKDSGFSDLSGSMIGNLFM
jgi:hypothetical protein